MAKKEMDKLSKEAIQCEKDGYGVHYGAWKAAQAPVKIEPKPDVIGIPVRTCAWCGAEFYREDPRAIYCGDKCRRLKNLDCMREKYREKRGAENA